jgi:transposase
MTGSIPKIEILDGRERRRRWTTAEKLAMVEETYAPDVTVSLVARRNGVQPNQLFHWRKLAAQGALTATSGAAEPSARAAAPAWQEDDGSRDPEGRP